MHFKADAPLKLPNPPGLMWHSLFGKALHDISCTHPTSNCEDCFRLHDCDYPVLLKPGLPPGSVIMKKYTQIPAPHVFQISTVDDISAPVKEFSVRFSLIGNANDRLPAVLLAMQKLGTNGLGIDRVPAALTAVSRHRQNGVIEKLQHSSVDFDKPESIDVPEAPKSYSLQFISPYLPTGSRSARPQDFDLSAFLMAVVRRVDLLGYFYNGIKLEGDFKGLKRQSLIDTGCSATLDNSECKHYSHKNREGYLSKGLTGILKMEDQTAATFWPFLYAGQFLNAGKKASYGMGQFRCVS